MHIFKLVTVIFAVMPCLAHADVSGLGTAIAVARSECAGMSEKLNDIKKMAGLGTAMSATGAAAGAGATATGVMKFKQDQDATKIDEQIQALEADIATAEQDARQYNLAHADENAAKAAIARIYAALRGIEVPKVGSEFNRDEINAAQEQLSVLKSQRDANLQKSKTLGNVRTGLAAGAAATNVAGAVISGTNRVDDSLTSSIDACKKSVDELKRLRAVAATERTASDDELAMADKIVDGCYSLEIINLDSINRRGVGAMGANIAGAATGVAAAATSGVATNRVGQNDDKTKNLNIASTALSGVTGAASLTAVVFNAMQIGAIKRAAEIIDKCQEALQ